MAPQGSTHSFLPRLPFFFFFSLLSFFFLSPLLFVVSGNENRAADRDIFMLFSWPGRHAKASRNACSSQRWSLTRSLNILPLSPLFFSLLLPPLKFRSKLLRKKLCIYGNGQLIDPMGFPWHGENLFTLATEGYFSSDIFFPSSQAFL